MEEKVIFRLWWLFSPLSKMCSRCLFNMNALFLVCLSYRIGILFCFCFVKYIVRKSNYLLPVCKVHFLEEGHKIYYMAYTQKQPSADFLYLHYPIIYGKKLCDNALICHNLGNFFARKNRYKYEHAKGKVIPVIKGRKDTV